MALNGTNMRSHQELVASLVRNNGPLTRKIPFRTALFSILTALSPIFQSVTKKRTSTSKQTLAAIREGQAHLEARTRARPTVYEHLTPVGLGDPADDCEAQAA